MSFPASHSLPASMTHFYRHILSTFNYYSICAMKDLTTSIQQLHLWNWGLIKNGLHRARIYSIYILYVQQYLWRQCQNLYNTKQIYLDHKPCSCSFASCSFASVAFFLLPFPSSFSLTALSLLSHHLRPLCRQIGGALRFLLSHSIPFQKKCSHTHMHHETLNILSQYLYLLTRLCVHFGFSLESLETNLGM